MYHKLGEHICNTYLTKDLYSQYIKANTLEKTLMLGKIEGMFGMDHYLLLVYLSFLLFIYFLKRELHETRDLACCLISLFICSLTNLTFEIWSLRASSEVLSVLLQRN